MDRRVHHDYTARMMYVGMSITELRCKLFSGLNFVDIHQMLFCASCKTPPQCNMSFFEVMQTRQVR